MIKLDFAGLNQFLLVRATTLLWSWLPGGTFKGNEFACGDLTGVAGGSLLVNLRTGKWIDNATSDKGGDLISLYGAIKNLNPGDAYKQLADDHGYRGATVTPLKIDGKPEIGVPPIGFIAPTMNHQRHGQATAKYEYKDASGRTLYYVARYDRPDGKEFCPWSWITAKARWSPQGWPAPRPLYGLDLLAANPTKPVLIVEGEKCAEVARAIVGNPYVTITWSGGCKAWKQADWEPVTGRKVLIWPDADPGGVEAAAGIAAKLVMQNDEIKILDTTGMPHKWDVADSGFDWPQLKDWAVPRARVIAKPSLLPVVLGAEAGLVTRRIEGVTAPYIKNNLPHRSERGKPRGTIENFETMIDMLGIVIRYNVIAKREEILIPDESYSIDNRSNAAYARVLSWMNDCEMPVGALKNFITYMAERNQYNPVVEWIQSKPWDGVSRLQSLYDTVTARNETTEAHTKHLKEVMIRRWMISAIQAAFNPRGVSAHGVLVFQGNQDLGKTHWFLQLAPKEMEIISEGRILKPDDKDSVKQNVSFWIIELGELDATFKKSDIAQLKAFLTKDRDILRLAYAPTESEFARRTVFFASVNPHTFLHDPTGNRRFWTIACEKINHEHGLDMQQTWAEVHHLWARGESWFLDKLEISLLNEHNESFTGIEPVQERIGTELDWDSAHILWTWKTVSEVLEDLKFDRVTRSDLNSAGAEIRKRNGGIFRKNNGNKELFVPKRRGQQATLRDGPYVGP